MTTKEWLEFCCGRCLYLRQVIRAHEHETAMLRDRIAELKRWMRCVPQDYTLNKAIDELPHEKEK